MTRASFPTWSEVQMKLGSYLPLKPGARDAIFLKEDNPKGKFPGLRKIFLSLNAGKKLS